MTLFDNKYRIESARKQGWDYADNGYYFVTICTKDRQHFFGEIENGEMILNEYGKIVQEEWEKSFEIRKELFCDAFIIMPNHIHGIVILEKDDILHVETHGRASLHRSPKSISSFVAGFKSVVTTRINQIRKTPKMPLWQPRFHDHILRDEIELYNVRNYIANNPRNWYDDEFYEKAA